MDLNILILILQLIILIFQIIQLRNQMRLHKFIGMPKIDIKCELKLILSKIINIFKRG